MDLELDVERIMREEAWWWIQKIMAAYRAIQTRQGALDSGLL